MQAHTRPLALIVLAAGAGTRMNSDLPKPLHALGNAPLLAHTIASGAALEPSRIIVITGHGADAVESALSDVSPEAEAVRQDPQLGTGHAVLQAAEALAGFDGDAMVLYGDSPFFRPETLQAMRISRDVHDVVMLGFRPADPGRYGRMVMDGDVVVADVKISESKAGKSEAFIVEVIKRAHTTVAGKLIHEEGLAYLSADNNSIDNIMVPNESLHGAQNNDYVIVNIKKYPYQSRPAFGEVIAVLGQQLNHELSMQLTIVSENLPHEWPADVEKMRDNIPKEVDHKALGPHKDIRDIPLITKSKMEI